MWCIGSFSLISILVIICFAVGGAIDCVSNQISSTLTVDLHGGANFTKIQDAVKAIPPNSTQWIRILVSPGIYKGQVLLQPGLSCIFLQGSGMANTILEWNAHGETNTSATFTTWVENFVARDISFKNTYNHDAVNKLEEGSAAKVVPAVAAEIIGDKSTFHNCGFYGLQDTLWDVGGRHYFISCHIEGAVDFIWGGGQSIYENCEINSIVDVLGPGFYGYITAQDRNSADESNGFVFKGGKVIGGGMTDLGRAYAPYSRVLFYGTDFSGIIRPEGWDNWNKTEINIVFAEESCKGPGSDKSGRVKWLKELPQAEIQQLTDVATFIDQGSWLSKQPPL